MSLETTNKKEKISSLKLRFVGFCGVDESFHEKDEKWPEYIEWGILFRPEKEGLTRFPKKEWVEEFVKDKTHLAAHLCSTRCEEVLKGDFSFVRTLHNELGFHRFQINATKANGVDSSSFSVKQVENLLCLAKEFPEAEIIIQRNEETKTIWTTLENMKEEDLPENIVFLFDASVGKGLVIKEFHHRPRYSSSKFGFAGGIRSDNVEEVIRNISSSMSKEREVSIWIDMESGIRNTSDDTFSSSRARAVCEVINKLVEEGVITFVNE